MRPRQILPALLAATLLSTGTAQGETLRDALVRAYNSNPTLTAARARLRATDENVAIAKALGRPQVDGTAGLNQSFNGIATFDDNGRALTLGADVSMPLYAGGGIRGAIKGAKERVMAGRADLRGTEGDVFTDVVASYMDVMLARAVVRLNRNQVDVLVTNLEATRDRFEIGDLTRTDVAQSEARLALAKSALATAEGRLIGANENYLRLTGAAPDELVSPPPLPPLPETGAAATDVAVNENPDLSGAIASARAAGYDISVAKADRLPVISAGVGASYSNYLGTLDNALGVPGTNVDQVQTTSRVGISARIPLYQGGGAGARVRQARDLEQQARENIVAVERFVVANARATHADYKAALDTIASNEQAVSANRLALEGTRAENSVGTRSVLDVLDAEQALLNSEVALVTARRNAYVAGFALLNALGRAEMKDLGLDGGALYDPVVHYDDTSRSISDWSDGQKRATEATRTYGPPAPTGQ
jgi:outer membrane protein